MIIFERECRLMTGAGRGGARGGLEGAIALRQSMLAPRRKVNSDFFRRFLAFIVP